MDDDLANGWQNSGKPEVSHRFDSGSTLTDERTNGLTDVIQDSGAKSLVPDPPNGVDNRVPKRIQMSRQHPWRAENPDAVIVARPSKWGNPNRASDPNWYYPDELMGAGAAVLLFRHDLTGDGIWWHKGDRYMTLEDVRSELAGKDLACWCALDQPCHADILLELANGGEL